MAVDFLALPLSKYLAGDFVTPEMEKAWSEGHDARIETPDGEVLLCSKGTRVGGVGARKNAKKWREAMDAYRRSLPHDIETIEWNEDASDGGVVESVTHHEWGALTTCARKHFEKRQGMVARLLSGRPSPASHLVNGGVFVDAAFARPFQKGTVIFASLPGALVEIETLLSLDKISPDTGGHVAQEAFVAAAVHARSLCVPMIVDA